VQLLPTIPGEFVQFDGATTAVNISYRYNPGGFECLGAVNGSCIQQMPVDPTQAPSWARSDGLEAGMVIRARIDAGDRSIEETLFVPFAGQFAGAVMG
jgi:hypothetical protein